VTAPQSGDRSKVYASPPPVLLHFVAIVQYQYPPPLHPHDDDSAAELDEDADASAAAAAAGSGDSNAASSTSSSSSSSSSPLVLIAEAQCASLLVSLTLLPPFGQRAAELAPFYTLRPSPNMLDPRNRLANARFTGGSGGSGGSARTKGLGSKKFSWRDEVVFACAAAPGLECSLCTTETVPSSVAAQLGSVAPFSSLCLSFLVGL